MIQVIITEQDSTIVVRGNGNYWNFRVVSYEGDCYNFWHNTLEEGTRHQMVDEARRTLQGMHLQSVIEIIALDSPAEWTEEDWQTTDERHWWELSGYPECDPDEDSECYIDDDIAMYFDMGDIDDGLPF